MKKIALLGANGFIGKNLVKHLTGYNVIAGTRADADLVDLESLVIFFEKHKPDIVINLAAYKKRGKSLSNFREAIESNVLGTLNIIEAAKACGSVKHMVFLGSAEEYGSGQAPFTEDQKELPISAYSASKTSSKIILETLFRLEKLPFTYLRPSLVYGPEQGDEMFISSLIKSLKNKVKFPMTLGEQIRDFIHVDDLSMAILKVIESGEKTFGKVYNVGGGEQKTIKEIALLIGNKLNCVELLEIGSMPYRDAEIFDYRCSIEKIEQELGWKPKITIEKGLEDLIN